VERKNIYEKKYFSLKALDVDTATRQVKVAIAQMEDVDRDNDVFAKTAFDRTIKAKGPQGSNELWHLLDHTPTSFSALSKFSEVYKDGIYIVGVSKYKDSFAWREVAWPLYEGGDFTQHSVGFRTLKSENRGDYREITEVELWEGSAVLWGAQPDTPTIGVTKGITVQERSKDLQSRLNRLCKFIQSCQDIDESKSLIEIEFKQIQQQLVDLENSTQPAEKAPDPEVKEAIVETLTKTRELSGLTKFLNN
jgi:phage head maturation protease